jgi:hypothetical protein
MKVSAQKLPLVIHPNEVMSERNIVTLAGLPFAL